jgi:hypothetical protein
MRTDLVEQSQLGGWKYRLVKVLTKFHRLLLPISESKTFNRIFQNPNSIQKMTESDADWPCWTESTRRVKMPFGISTHKNSESKTFNRIFAVFQNPQLCSENDWIRCGLTLLNRVNSEGKMPFGISTHKNSESKTFNRILTIFQNRPTLSQRSLDSMRTDLVKQSQLWG